MPIPGFSALESMGFENLDLRSGSNATRFPRSLGYKFKDNNAVNGWNRQAMSEHFKGSRQVCPRFTVFFPQYTLLFQLDGTVRLSGTLLLFDQIFQRVSHALKLHQCVILDPIWGRVISTLAHP